jgi:hypothetical protein
VSAVEHPYALRTPWYVRELEQWTQFDPAARRPAIQKYATPDFIDRLLADPRDSLRFDDDDRWSFPVKVGFPAPGTGRERFADHRLVRTPMRKLYQPSHDRFYILAVELFCDEPGLPRPGDVAGVEVRFVVRRERVRFLGQQSAVRALARSLIRELARKAGDRVVANLPSGKIPNSEDLDDLVWGQQASDHQFSATQLRLLKQIRPQRTVEAWVVTSAGHGNWHEVGAGEQPALLAGEQELPMWRLPPRAEDCQAARTRSLWFGVVPTYSSDVDGSGRPKLDDRSIYRLRCFARRPPAPGQEHCPPEIWWSEPTRPYRLAAFFDPAGSKNRRVSVKMPDLRDLAARAAEPAGPGGMEIVQPPGSQLAITTPGELPKPGQGGNPDGLAASSCTFAIELFTIVAMFVFNLFLPVVLFVFQLWWMLALRFCFPRDAAAFANLETFLASNDLDDIDNGSHNTELGQLDDLLETPGGAALLAAQDEFKNNRDLAGAVLDAIDPSEALTSVDPVPEPRPCDPLCAPPG